jgi:hypothetical protein
MALKFLNKKGWHTGSLRNIERVWKAEQAEEAEKCKTEELKEQVAAERVSGRKCFFHPSTLRLSRLDLRG